MGRVNAPVIRDRDIRSALGPKLRLAMGDDAVLVEELGLCQGDVFVDVAMINGHLEGYEIKSDRDSLRRLDRQSTVYSRVLARATLVVTEKHLADARKVIPRWWGILLARLTTISLEFISVRTPRRNPAIDPSALVQLLWRDEALQVLDGLGKAKGLASRPRREIWGRLLEECSLRELQTLVCSRIKGRGEWRSAPRRTQDGDSCPRAPMSPDFQSFRHSSGS